MIEPLLIPFATGPPADLPIGERIRRRAWHPEWAEHEAHWRWLWDSYEGGDRYRDAVYGTDSRGYPVRNLIRHFREYPTPREEQLGIGPRPGYPGGAAPTSDPYESRRQRTPEPDFLREAITRHLSKVLTREITRTGPPALEAWWKDVDGRGTPVDDWVKKVLGPLLLLYGQVDVACDHPPAPPGARIDSRADAAAAGVTTAVVSVVLPENLVWWRLDWRGRYAECIVRERRDDGAERYRHWTAESSALRTPDGKADGAPVAHRFGRVPVERVFDQRKLRCTHAGDSRYKCVARIQHAYYNKESELALADTTQAHPLPMGPEVYCQGEGDVPIGPGNVLPMAPIHNAQGMVAGYQPWQVLDFPKGASESIRANLDRLRDAADRAACLTKPAGASGTSRGTVGQSGVSKQLDDVAGDDLCKAVAAAARGAELVAAALALTVLSDGPPPAAALASIRVDYPTTFNLFSLDQLAAGSAEFQGILAAAGEAPGVESDLLSAIVRELLPGRDDATYRRYDAEVEAAVAGKARDREQAAEGTLPRFDGATDDDDTQAPPGDEPGAATDGE